MAELPLTDREQLLAAQEAEAIAAEVFHQIQQQRACGLGAAAFVLGMWDGLDGSGLTREEKLALLGSALRGR